MPARSQKASATTSAKRDASASVSTEGTVVRGRREKAFQLANRDHKLVLFFLPLEPEDPELPVWSVIRMLSDKIGAGQPYPKGGPKGNRGGAQQICTPTSIVRLIVQILVHFHGSILDPVCVSGACSSGSPASRMRSRRIQLRTILDFSSDPNYFYRFYFSLAIYPLKPVLL